MLIAARLGRHERGEGGRGEGGGQTGRRGNHGELHARCTVGTLQGQALRVPVAVDDDGRRGGRNTGGRTDSGRGTNRRDPCSTQRDGICARYFGPAILRLFCFTHALGYKSYQRGYRSGWRELSASRKCKESPPCTCVKEEALN